MHTLADAEVRLQSLERAKGEIVSQMHLAAEEAVAVEDAHQQCRVRHRRTIAALAVARWSREAPAESGPTCTSPVGVMETMLPPPAPRVTMSVDSALTRRSCSSSKVVFTQGWPSITTLMSHDVPPTSAQIRLPSPMYPPKWALLTVPAAGPPDDESVRALHRVVRRQQPCGAIGEVQLTSEAERAQALLEARGVLAVLRFITVSTTVVEARRVLLRQR